METSRLTRDGPTEPVSRDQILRRERGQEKIHFPCSADHVQDLQPYPVDPYSCYMCDHTTLVKKFDVLQYYRKNIRENIFYAACQLRVQWWLRFKRGVCHARETSLKHDPLLIRFQRGFLLDRDPGVRETSLRQDYIGFRVPVAGINSAGRDARVVVTNRSVQRAFYMFDTILLCVTGPTPSAIPPYYCVRYSSTVAEKIDFFCGLKVIPTSSQHSSQQHRERVT